MRKLLKLFWVASLVLVFFLLILPYVSPRYKGLLSNFITPILPGLSDDFYSESKLLLENQELQKRLRALESRQDYWDSLFSENQKLRKLLKMELIVKFEALVAKVTVKNPLTGKYRFVVDRGSADGLKLGMPVMTGGALLGRVTELQKKTAVVGTLAKSTVKVFCQIKGTNFYGKLNGEGDRLEDGKLVCQLVRLPRDAKITPGMVVNTSGFSSDNDRQASGVGLIPKNLQVGIVKSVSKNEKFQNALVELSANWVSFEYVTILIKSDK